MARLGGLLIQGIRSFGPEENDRQVIHFNSPLTLILGRNGCGKTTIIEALKYSTIGEFPFGQGAAFVHDPRMANEVTVKGQVKLEFDSVKKSKLTVTRGLVATQKPKKVEVSALDNTIHCKDPDGKKTTLSSRCVDINELIMDNLGVSKSVISNVIFCHQEDSNWPLEEGKKLKEKFDDIFESTGHNKFLEDIRLKRKRADENLKRINAELLFLTDKKESARKMRRQLEDLQKRFEDKEKEFAEAKASCVSAENRYKDLSKRNENYVKVISARETKRAQYESLVEQQEQLRANIKEEFIGSSEELESAINDFKMQMRDKAAGKRRYENEIGRLKIMDDEYLKQTNVEMNKLGGIKVEIDLQEQRVKDRNEKLALLIDKCGLSGLSDIPTEADVRQSLTEAEDHMKELNNRIEFKRNQHDEEEKLLQADLDGKRAKITRLQQEIRGKESLIQNTQADIKEKNDKLAKVASSEKRLGDVEAQIDRFRGELDRLNQSVDVDALKAEIAEKKDNCIRLDARQSSVNDELKSLLVYATHQNKVNELEKQQSTLSGNLKKLRNKNKEGIERLLQNAPEGSMNYELKRIVQKLDDQIRRDTEKISRKERQLNEKTMQRKYKVEELSKFETEYKNGKAAIYELCGSQTLDSAIAKEEEKLEKLQEDIGMLSSSTNMFKNYIKKLKEEDPCCPLCQRNFDNNDDAPMLVEELSSKISSVPTKLKENEEAVNKIKTKLKKMLALRSTSERVNDLEKRLKPASESELQEFEAEIESLGNELACLKADVVVPEENVALGRSMLSDVGVMDQLFNDLKKVNAEVEKTKKLIPSGGSKRTIEEVQVENDMLREELADTRRDREALETQLHKHRESLNSLEQKLNQKVTEQLEIRAMVQERAQIEDRVRELKIDLKNLESERQTLRSQLVPAKDEMEAAEELMRTTKTAHRTEIEQINKEISRKRSQLDQVLNLQSTILNTEKKRLKDQLDEVQSEIERLNKQRKDCRDSISETEVKLNVVIQDLANSQNKERDLQDNLQLMRKGMEAVKVEAEMNKLTAEIQSLDIETVREQLKVLSREAQDAHTRAAKCDGVVAELTDRIRSCKAELSQDVYRLADENHRIKFLEMEVQQVAAQDLHKFYVAYDSALMQYHNDKMSEINAIIKELWVRIYRGNDIDYIAIRTDVPALSVTAEAGKRRQYNYRVVQIKHETELDMRGRCSAGQKILSSLIIRMALAETLSLKCGILTLDEPTCNLDEANIISLSNAILEIVERRMQQSNFQLIVITHDPHFIKLLSQADFISHYYDVSRNNRGLSVIKKVNTSELEE